MRPLSILDAFRIMGPAFLVSVALVDPGNWATAIEAGSRFGYELVWVVVASNLIAILLQTLAARLGIVTGKHLAQVCRESYPPQICGLLWVLCEISIVALDLTMLLGTAIGLNMLLGWPLLPCILMTALDALLLLLLVPAQGVKKSEALTVGLLGIVVACFLVDLLVSRPPLRAVVGGLVPRLRRDSVYTAVSLLGANVMPHNFYLHSALVSGQGQAVAAAAAAAAASAGGTACSGTSYGEIRALCLYNFLDIGAALGVALVINVAVLLVSAATFHSAGVLVHTLQAAHDLMEQTLSSSIAPAAFGTALLCAGQLSTFTGTIAGQVVLQGFLNIHISTWLRRLITRTAAIIPAAVLQYVYGDRGTYKFLLIAQVVLALQLPVTLVPLIKATSCRKLMGPHASSRLMAAAAWAATGLVFLANLMLFVTQMLPQVSASGRGILDKDGPLDVWIDTIADLAYRDPLRAVGVLSLLVAASAFLALQLWMIVTPLRVAAPSTTAGAGGAAAAGGEPAGGKAFGDAADTPIPVWTARGTSGGSGKAEAGGEAGTDDVKSTDHQQHHHSWHPGRHQQQQQPQHATAGGAASYEHVRKTFRGSIVTQQQQQEQLGSQRRSTSGAGTPSAFGFTNAAAAAAAAWDPTAPVGSDPFSSAALAAARAAAMGGGWVIPMTAIQMATFQGLRRYSGSTRASLDGADGPLVALAALQLPLPVSLPLPWRPRIRRARRGAHGEQAHMATARHTEAADMYSDDSYSVGSLSVGSYSGSGSDSENSGSEAECRGEDRVTKVYGNRVVGTEGGVKTGAPADGEVSGMDGSGSGLVLPMASSVLAVSGTEEGRAAVAGPDPSAGAARRPQEYYQAQLSERSRPEAELKGPVKLGMGSSGPSVEPAPRHLPETSTWEAGSQGHEGATESNAASVPVAATHDASGSASDASSAPRRRHASGGTPAQRPAHPVTRGGRRQFALLLDDFWSYFYSAHGDPVGTVEAVASAAAATSAAGQPASSGQAQRRQHLHNQHQQPQQEQSPRPEQGPQPHQEQGHRQEPQQQPQLHAREHRSGAGGGGGSRSARGPSGSSKAADAGGLAATAATGPPVPGGGTGSAGGPHVQTGVGTLARSPAWTSGQATAAAAAATAAAGPTSPLVCSHTEGSHLCMGCSQALFRSVQSCLLALERLEGAEAAMWGPWPLQVLLPQGNQTFHFHRAVLLAARNSDFMSLQALCAGTYRSTVDRSKLLASMPITGPSASASPNTADAGLNAGLNTTAASSPSLSALSRGAHAAASSAAGVTSVAFATTSSATADSLTGRNLTSFGDRLGSAPAGGPYGHQPHVQEAMGPHTGMPSLKRSWWGGPVQSQDPGKSAMRPSASGDTISGDAMSAGAADKPPLMRQPAALNPQAVLPHAAQLQPHRVLPASMPSQPPGAQSQPSWSQPMPQPQPQAPGSALPTPTLSSWCLFGPAALVSLGVWSAFTLAQWCGAESRPELWGRYAAVLNRLQGVMWDAQLDVAAAAAAAAPSFDAAAAVNAAAGTAASAAAGMESIAVESVMNPAGRAAHQSTEHPHTRQRQPHTRGQRQQQHQHHQHQHQAVHGDQGHAQSQRQKQQPVLPATAIQLCPGHVALLRWELLQQLSALEEGPLGRRGPADTAAGEVAFPKGKEILVSVLRRYRRRLGGTGGGGGEGGSHPGAATPPHVASSASLTGLATGGVAAAVTACASTAQQSST